MTLFTLYDRRAFISSRSIAQLTNVIPSSSSRSNINGHTVGLQKTNHSTASLMRNLHTPDFVSLHDSVLFWLTPNNVAASVIFFLANTKSVWRKGIHIIVHLLVLDRIRSKRSKARRAKLFLQLGLDASLSFLSTSRRENPRIREHLHDVERNDKDASKPSR